MSKNITLTEAEEKLAELIWRTAPLTSPELVALMDKEMSWKKSTTYTVLKKLCDKGIFKNENANVSVVLTRDELIARQSRHYVENTFGGSLPKFITAFMGGKKLTREQANELKHLIEQHEQVRALSAPQIIPMNEQVRALSAPEIIPMNEQVRALSAPEATPINEQNGGGGNG